MAVASARHILVKTKAEAEKLKQRLAQGEDFGKLAKSTPSVIQPNAVVSWVKFDPARW